MFVGLLVGMEGWYSTKCKLTWKVKDMKYNRLLFQLQASTLPIEEIEFGLLLKTPTAMDGMVKSGKKNPKSGDSGTLAQEIMSQYKPTMDKLSMLPTPTATDWKGAYPPTSIDKFPARRNMMRNVYQYQNKEYNSKTSQLSPQFVMEMMGFPTDWTILPFLNGDKSPLKPEATQ
jgi:hypothetical protein